MDRRNCKRGKKNSKAVCPRISKRYLADFTGLDEKKIALVIIEAFDDDECEIFPAVTAVGAEYYVNLARGETTRYGARQNIFPATVVSKGEDFIFTSCNFSRKVSVSMQQLKSIFGDDVVC